MAEKILGLIIVLVLAGCGLVYWSGYFNNGQLGVQTYPEMHVLYEARMGPYVPPSGPLVEEVQQAAKSLGVKCDALYSELLDNTKKVAGSNLRSNWGCVISGPVTPKPPLMYKVIPQREVAVYTFRGLWQFASQKFPAAHAKFKADYLKSEAGPTIILFPVDGSFWAQPMQTFLSFMKDKKKKTDVPSSSGAGTPPK